MLIAIRHGHTAFNEDGREKARGWLPIPLTVEGMNAMVDTAESLEDVEDIKAIYCSDLVRAVQSAEEVAHALSMPIIPREEVRDWDSGDMAGKEIKEVLPLMHKAYENPGMKVPGGETFQTFLDRCVPFLDKLVKSDDLNIVVTHNRVMTLIKALSVNGGKHPDTETLKRKGPVEPSGVIVVGTDWKIRYMLKKHASVGKD